MQCPERHQQRAASEKLPDPQHAHLETDVSRGPRMPSVAS